MKTKTLVAALITGFSIASIIGAVVPQEYQSSPDITQPKIVHSLTCKQGVQGFYNTGRNDITMCILPGHPDYDSTLRHEYQHFLQDAQDGIQNGTVETVTDRTTLTTIWNHLEKTNHPLYQHITQYYHPSHWVIELEAYLLQESPYSVTHITIESH
jgi:hypothetical protein